ncbi:MULTISPECIES: hypothetical protein [unclassified Streptomyces]|uniref:hypothetical protein n=1 Tax=unclassified Streptomyces TaxID=2593676 RepID=UPI003817B460
MTHGGRASLLDAVQGATPVLVMGVLTDPPDNAATFARRARSRAPCLRFCRSKADLLPYIESHVQAAFPSLFRTHTDHLPTSLTGRQVGLRAPQPN